MIFLWEKNFNLYTKEHKHGEGFLLSFSVTDGVSEKFRNIVKNYIEKEVPSMTYKLFLG